MATLMCESCGYDISTLEADGRCPECGREIARSLPSHRLGSPWQQRPSLRSLGATNYRAIRDTRALYDTVRLDTRSGVSLFAANALLSSFLIVLPWSGVLVGDPVRNARGSPGTLLAMLWVLPLQTIAVALLLLALTMIEWAGIRAMARTRGWRLTRAAAWQVCAHASVGWIITALTSWTGLVLLVSLTSFGHVSQIGMLFSAPIVGALFGLVVFELLVWTGLRRLRFANPPDAGLVTPHLAAAAA